VDWKPTLVSVIPAEAGIQAVLELEAKRTWMPAFAGMTKFHFASSDAFQASCEWRWIFP
jgi:hypothetical protein